MPKAKVMVDPVKMLKDMVLGEAIIHKPSWTVDDLTILEEVVEKVRKVIYNREDKKTILLKAAHNLLRKCDEGPYIKNALAEEIEYAGSTGDGYSLMNDIAAELDLEQF